MNSLEKINQQLEDLIDNKNQILDEMVGRIESQEEIITCLDSRVQIYQNQYVLTTISELQDLGYLIQQKQQRSKVYILLDVTKMDRSNSLICHKDSSIVLQSAFKTKFSSFQSNFNKKNQVNETFCQEMSINFKQLEDKVKALKKQIQNLTNQKNDLLEIIKKQEECMPSEEKLIDQMKEGKDQQQKLELPSTNGQQNKQATLTVNPVNQSQKIVESYVEKYQEKQSQQINEILQNEVKQEPKDKINPIDSEMKVQINFSKLFPHYEQKKNQKQITLKSEGLCNDNLNMDQHKLKNKATSMEVKTSKKQSDQKQKQILQTEFKFTQSENQIKNSEKDKKGNEQKNYQCQQIEQQKVQTQSNEVNTELLLKQSTDNEKNKEDESKKQANNQNDRQKLANKNQINLKNEQNNEQSIDNQIQKQIDQSEIEKQIQKQILKQRQLKKQKGQSLRKINLSQFENDQKQTNNQMVLSLIEQQKKGQNDEKNKSYNSLLLNESENRIKKQMFSSELKKDEEGKYKASPIKKKNNKKSEKILYIRK